MAANTSNGSFLNDQVIYTKKDSIWTYKPFINRALGKRNYDGVLRLSQENTLGIPFNNYDTDSYVSHPVQKRLSRRKVYVFRSLPALIQFLRTNSRHLQRSLRF